jgi:hypothetical protein
MSFLPAAMGPGIAAQAGSRARQASRAQRRPRPRVAAWLPAAAIRRYAARALPTELSTLAPGRLEQLCGGLDVGCLCSARVLCPDDRSGCCSNLPSEALGYCCCCRCWRLIAAAGRRQLESVGSAVAPVYVVSRWGGGGGHLPPRGP